MDNVVPLDDPATAPWGDLVPLENPVTAQWGYPLTHSDYNKMLKGFTPRDMDDKWVVATDTPDAQGNTIVRICRSWTATEQFLLTIAARNSNEAETKHWATIVKISWNKKPGALEVTEEDAIESAVNLCKGLLGSDTTDTA
ncbi:hypothetical protein ACMFMF_000959 [Clarireedia jacksonii]